MQYKAGTKCNNSLSGPENKDGALGGWLMLCPRKSWAVFRKIAMPTNYRGHM